MWPEQLEIVIPEKERQGLVHLKQSQILSNTCEKSVSANRFRMQHKSLIRLTDVAPTAELEHITLHVLRIAF
jgi:hypothetical protein